ncbi:MAG: UPF0182 family protein [Candidatus Margulisbacteria bacterium]|nr:UPF0182 family protein [Candidatus Margulisiibacteriota bacterium]
MIFWIALAVVAFLFLTFASQLINFYTDFLWFSQIGYLSIFTKIVWAKVYLFAFAFAVFFAFVFFNVQLADKLSRKNLLKVDMNVFEIFEENAAPILKKIIFGVVLFISFISATGASSLWEWLIKFQNYQPFGSLDPVFSKDIGFYVFQLPFIKFLHGYIMFVLFVAIIGSGLIYFFRRSFRITKLGLTITDKARMHLSILAALLVLGVSYGIRLSMFDLLVKESSLITGAGFVDVNAVLPLMYIMIGLCVISAIGFIAFAFTNKLTLAVSPLLLLIVVSLLGRGVYVELVQRLYVAPNELAKETPYIKRHVAATNLAFDLNRIKVKELEVSTLNQRDLNNNRSTLQNIRLWDHRPLKETYSQLQEIRTYYDFNDVDVDRYHLNGDYREVMISARELSYSSLPSRIWINEHLTYTHGYGVVASPVNKVSNEGLPDFWIKNIPPKSTVGINVTRPEIYYGEESNDYCFVNTKSKEFDYPAGAKNVYSNYGGSGGVPTANLWRRLAFAARFSNMKILLSGDIKADSKIMYYREIGERIRAILPFIQFDPDPYIVVSEGKLYWIIDGYTSTNMYPYSRRYGSIGNYVRNSVKVVVDAYNGSVDFYISDTKDPIIAAYRSAFPEVFKSLDTLPEDLRKHVRYPEAIFKVQSEMYRTYHMTDPQIYYNKEDLWDIPTELYSGNTVYVDPYYIIMKLPGEKREEFVLIIPFTPNKKDNMSAWMAARSDGKNYGEITVYKFSKKKLIYGPMQIEARIDQDADISKELSLWSQRGSKVIRGNLLVIPIANSLIYVEPLYLKAERGEIPALTRVIVAYEDRVAMEETFSEALSSVLSGIKVGKRVAGEVAERVYQTPRELAGKALSLYNEAQKYLRQGNFAKYGETMDELGEALRKLSK